MEYSSKYSKSCNYLMLIFGLNETATDLLAVARSLVDHWYGIVLRRDNDQV